MRWCQVRKAVLEHTEFQFLLSSVGSEKFYRESDYMKSKLSKRKEDPTYLSIQATSRRSQIECRHPLNTGGLRRL